MAHAACWRNWNTYDGVLQYRAARLLFVVFSRYTTRMENRHCAKTRTQITFTQTFAQRYVLIRYQTWLICICYGWSSEYFDNIQSKRPLLAYTRTSIELVLCKHRIVVEFFFKFWLNRISIVINSLHFIRLTWIIKIGRWEIDISTILDCERIVRPPIPLSNIVHPRS